MNNLLDMARIQSDGFNLRKEWQTPEELIGSALQQLESALAKNTIQVNLPDEMVLVYCDAGLVERVFINLLENALKYAGEQATIAISASIIPVSLIAESTTPQHDAQESVLEIIVQDNGPGIELGQESMIFDKFSRGHKESSIPGVGLGAGNLPGNCGNSRWPYLGNECEKWRRGFPFHASAVDTARPRTGRY
nr:ATP-binding protein [Pectobacterium colocasium]